VDNSLGTNWVAPNYNDNPAQTGFKWNDIDTIYRFVQSGAGPPCEPVSTEGSLGPRTYYWRSKFNVFTNFLNAYTNAGANPTLRFRHIIDDGAVIWLNGQQVARVRMPSGNITYFTFGQPMGGNPTCQTLTTNLPVGILTRTDNTFAVEVHVAGDPDPDNDVAFGLEVGLAYLTGPKLPAEPAPRLEVSLVDADTVNLSWSSGHGYALESSTNVTGRYVEVPNMRTNMNVDIPGRTMFFRLHKVN
jgi:hypothetical protein